jgi:alcohol dehydrogenase
MASPGPIFDVHPGPRLVIGPGSVDRLGTLAAELGATRALVVSDPGIVASGHTWAGQEALAAAGIATEVFSAFGENPTAAQAEIGAAMAREFGPDLLIGLGGGSSMDCAKAINFLVSCGGTMRDYRGRDRATGPLLPSIAVPTTAGTGSETQSFALVTDEQGAKMACGDRRAAFRIAVLDVRLTLTQPDRVAALTGIDAIAHAVESHVSLAATPVSRMLSRQAWTLLATQLPRVFNDRTDLEARAAVQLGAAWAGLAIENSMLGAAHALANPLTATRGVVHGQAVGLMLPHVVRFNGPVCGPAYAELLSAIGRHVEPNDAPHALAELLERWLGQAGLAGSLAALGLGPDLDTAALGRVASEQWTATFNPRLVSAPDLTRLYEAAR